jgi:TIR domain
MQAPETRYDVALSFAGEDRVHALALATHLQDAGYRVFFDRFEELWGQDLSVRLQEVYARQSRFCVVFVSASYLRKPWTNHERRIVIDRAMQQEAPYLLPLRLDDTELPGLPGIVAYKDLREESIDNVARALVRLLGPAQPIRAPLATGSLRIAPSDFLYVVVESSARDMLRFNLACHVVNPDDRSRTLVAFEATLVRNAQRPIQFFAGPLYETSVGGRAMQRSGDSLPLLLAARESRLLGIQFVGPRIDPAQVWCAGRPTLEVVGWADGPGRREPPDLACSFVLQLGDSEAAQIAPWLAQDWPAYPAASHAVALPVGIA